MRVLLFALVLGTASATVSTSWAQDGGAAVQRTKSTDAEARAVFEEGRAAFDSADYERALAYFRHAYRLSDRPELQYNIGVAADRLQREDEALAAFEAYLANTTQPTREAEVRERIEALRESIEVRESTERALAEATKRTFAETAEQEATAARLDSTDDPRRLSRATIAGGSALAAVGAAGVTAMAVGLARDGSCASTVNGECVTERSTTAWTWVYGGLGAAALAGSATWFVLGARRQREVGRPQVALRGAGLQVSGVFH